jgi:hypothetical protein
MTATAGQSESVTRVVVGKYFFERALHVFNGILGQDAAVHGGGCKLGQSIHGMTSFKLRGNTGGPQRGVPKRGGRDRLQIRAEGEQTTVAILHYKLARVPGHVGESPSELHALGCILGVKRVRIFDE